MSYDTYEEKDKREMLSKIRGILKKIYIKHENITFLKAEKLVEEELGMSSHDLPIKLDVYSITYHMIEDGLIKGKFNMHGLDTFTLIK